MTIELAPFFVVGVLLGGVIGWRLFSALKLWRSRRETRRVLTRTRRQLAFLEQMNREIPGGAPPEIRQLMRDGYALVDMGEELLREHEKAA